MVLNLISILGVQRRKVNKIYCNCGQWLCNNTVVMKKNRENIKIVAR